MTSYLRFADLKESGLVQSWAQLRRLQDINGFPPGRLLSENVRIWTEDEIEKYLADRPIKSSLPLKGGAKIRRERYLAKQTA
jgi:hypothetical protein